MQRGVPPVHLRTSEYLHVFSCATMPSSRMRSWSHRSNNHLNSSSKTSGRIAKGGNGVTAAPPLEMKYAFLDASEQQSDEATTRGTTTFEVSMRQCTVGCGTSDVCRAIYGCILFARLQSQQDVGIVCAILHPLLGWHIKHKVSARGQLTTKNHGDSKYDRQREFCRSLTHLKRQLQG